MFRFVCARITCREIFVGWWWLRLSQFPSALLPCQSLRIDRSPPVNTVPNECGFLVGRQSESLSSHSSWEKTALRSHQAYKHFHCTNSSFYVGKTEIKMVSKTYGIFCFTSFLKWSDMWPSMVTHTLNSCSAFNPSKYTHTAVNTHTGAVGSQCCGAQGAFGSLAPCSRAPQSWYWRWRESAGYSLPPPKIPAGQETRTRDLRLTSPTLHPLGHGCQVWVSKT